MSSSEPDFLGSTTMHGWRRWEPLTGIAFVVLFIGSVLVSMPPGDNASDKVWVANYTGHGNQIGHLATGILLMLAGLCLMSFLTVLWTRVAAARQPESLSPLPLVAAGVSAACFAVGGILMGGVAGSLLIGSKHVPGADLLRFGNDLGFGIIGSAGMFAAALSIACLSVQARSVGLFGRKLQIFGLAVAVVLLGSLAFIPILALLIWSIVTAIVLMRRSAIRARRPNFVAEHAGPS